MTSPGYHFFSNIGLLATCPGPKPTFNTTMTWRSHSVPATFSEELHPTIASRLQLNKNHYIYPVEFQGGPFNELPSSQLHIPHCSFRGIPRYQTHFPDQIGSTIRKLSRPASKQGLSMTCPGLHFFYYIGHSGPHPGHKPNSKTTKAQL